MVDPSEFLQSARIWAFIAMIWLLSVAAPVMIETHADKPNAALFVLIIGFWLFLIYRAALSWRLGRRRPLVLRALVPAFLFVGSYVLYWTGLWGAILWPAKNTH
jgi:hypothetical protein